MKGFLLFVFGSLCGAITMFLLMAPQQITTHVEQTATLSPVAEPIAIAPKPVPTAQLPVAMVQAPVMTTPVPSEPAASNQHVDTEPNTSMASSSSSTLMIPVEGINANRLIDTFDAARATGRRHDAIDIMAPKGTRVLAAADGKVVKLFTSVRGGLTVYEFDPTATYTYYYAHLDSYAPGITEGAKLQQGDLIGYVGSSGDASPTAPHLHFEITLLGPEKHWWQGTSINPYPVLMGRQSLAVAAEAAASASNAH
ncbi:MAG: M23 family metallopeptidase [Lysobacteraceae bacterium]